jgi:hypothetical protein
LCSVPEDWLWVLCDETTASACAHYKTRINTLCLSQTDYPLSRTLLTHTYSYVETDHSKEGTNVQLSVRGKMLPAQVSSSDAVVYMCEKLDRCSVSSVEDTLGVLWGCGGVVCAV